MQKVTFPTGRLWGQNGEDADTDRSLGAFLAHSTVENSVVAPFRSLGNTSQIAAHNRAGGLAEHVIDGFQPKAKIMVPKADCVVAQCLEGLHHQVWAAILNSPISKRRALKGIAVIEQQNEGALRLPPRLADQARRSCEANGWVRPIGIIIEAAEVHMQIGCRQNTDMRTGRLRLNPP